MMDGTEIRADEKLDALNHVLQSEEFRNSPRLSGFLTYIVKEEIDGRQARLKALSIAMEVYGRDIDFDPQSNALVRVEAGRLRKALEIFYAKVRPSVPVAIMVPKGSYVPRYRRLTSTRQGTASDIEVSRQSDDEAREPKPRNGVPTASHLYHAGSPPGPSVLRSPMNFTSAPSVDPVTTGLYAAGLQTPEGGRNGIGHLLRRTEWGPPHRHGEESEGMRLKTLEEENAKLKRLLADAILDNTVLKDLLSKKW